MNIIKQRLLREEAVCLNPWCPPWCNAPTRTTIHQALDPGGSVPQWGASCFRTEPTVLQSMGFILKNTKALQGGVSQYDTGFCFDVAVGGPVYIDPLLVYMHFALPLVKV